MVSIETCRSQAMYSHPLIVLLFGDLLSLVEELTDSKLELRKFLLLSDVSVIDGVLANLDVEVNSQLSSAEPLGAVRVEADHVL